MKRTVLILLAALAGCASQPAAQRAPAPTPTSAPDALLAIAGEPLVFAASDLDPALSGLIEATLNGERMPAWVDRVTLRTQAADGDRWRALPVEWRGADSTSGLTFVHVAVPAGARSGELNVAGVQRALRVEATARPAATPALAGDEALYYLAESGATDHWRLSLAGFGVGGLTDRHPAERAAALALAGQWRSALARLEKADRWLAGRVMLALTRSVEISGVRAPAWSADSDADERLRRELLDTSLSERAIADRARAWLSSQPVMIARVRDPASAGAAAVQLTDLSGRSAEAFVSTGRRDGAKALLRAWRSALLPAPVRNDDDGLLIASAGARSASVAVPTRLIVAEPPGARLGPLLPDLGLDEWLAAEPREPSAALAAAALLQKRAHANEWELYVECKAPDRSERDVLRVWLGPRDAPVETISIDSAGTFSSDRDPTNAALIAHHVSEDRWSASIAIPASAIAPDGTLLIGLTRERGAGDTRRRWAWPVALLPWEEAAGRAEIVLTDWYRLSR